MFPTALACLLLAAPPVPPTLYVEFDGKGGVNPSVPAAGTITATGTFTVPEGGEFMSVALEVEPRHSGPGLKIGRTITATVDTTAKPHKWSVKADGFEPGDYLVRCVLNFGYKGGTAFDEAWELRKVRIPAVGK